MHDQRHANGSEAATGELRTIGTGRDRQRVALYVGIVNATLLEQVTLLENAAAPTATSRSSPSIFLKIGAAIFRGKDSTEMILQVEQIIADSIDIGLVSHGWGISVLGLLQGWLRLHAIFRSANGNMGGNPLYILPSLTAAGLPYWSTHFCVAVHD
ncbi:MAG: hypothetical protein N838_05725 [Thiohalocapsa sp. PB-PSB1]|nr:MAG: hypothetical protein N838_05725 [Thiohalocapsa sp. PB-PSB1]